MNDLASQKTLREQLLTALNDLPQRRYIDNTEAEIWVDKVLAQEPDRAWWHYRRLFGIGGSEIGVLLGAEKGLFHPFSSARDVTKQKLLRLGLSTPNGDMARGTQMEPVARDMYRKVVESRGGHAILDDALSDKIGSFRDPNHPWLVGNPDDIVVEKGVLYIVDYKVPMPDQILHYNQDGIPFYYEAQLHHYKLIAEQVGLKIGGLRLCSLDLKNWSIDERDVPYSPELANQILATGDKYWNQYVLAGKNAPMVRLARSASLDDLQLEILEDAADENGLLALPDLDENSHNMKSPAKNGYIECLSDEPILVDAVELREKLLHYVQLFNAWRLLQIEAKDMSEMFAEAIANILPATTVPEDVDQLDANVVQIKYERVWNEDALIDAIRTRAQASGWSNEEVENILNGKNFRRDPTLNHDIVLNVLQDMGIDPFTDERFREAVVPGERRIDTLLNLARDLDVNKEIQWRSLYASRPETRTLLTREAFTGPLNDSRKENKERLRYDCLPMITRMAPEMYAERKRVVSFVEAGRLEDAKRKEEAKQRKKAKADPAATAASVVEPTEQNVLAEAAATATVKPKRTRPKVV